MHIKGKQIGRVNKLLTLSFKILKRGGYRETWNTFKACKKNLQFGGETKIIFCIPVSYIRIGWKILPSSVSPPELADFFLSFSLLLYSSVRSS